MLGRGQRELQVGPLAAATLIAFAMVAALPGSGGAAGKGVTDCDRFASPSGSNGAPGTQSRPVRSPQGLIDVLRSGQTGCFKQGTYSFGRAQLTEPGITLTSYGSDEVVLKGSIRVDPSGRRSRVNDLRISGPGQQAAVLIQATRFSLRGNTITNLHRSASCVLIGSYYSRRPPRGIHIVGNRIHDCGQIPRTNHYHGIYVADSHRAVIRRNWIYDNADRGIQLYPSAQRSIIDGNVIDQNGVGINFSGVDNMTSNNNVVRRNVISRSMVRWNAASGPTGPRAHGNVLRRNCVFASNRGYRSNGGIQKPSRNFRARRNKIANPRFVDPKSGDYRLRADSRCRRVYQG
jgi:parallel beta-helix repeat protein